MRNILFIGLGIVIATIPQFFMHSPHTERASADIRQTRAPDSLINPLLDCSEISETITVGQGVALRKELDRMIQEAPGIEQAAVYYRDLTSGQWIGVNQDVKFSPASLLKLPIAMAYYWLSAGNRGVLAEKIAYHGESVEQFEQHFKPAHLLESGEEYSVQELISLMLTESNNEAALLLANSIDSSLLLKIYRDFGQESPVIGQDFLMSAHTYGGFFRILYNATYLDRLASEALLETMTHSIFNEGIEAGVPLQVKVAHKFGNRAFAASTTQQLHDCGIVYAEKPYILCVMSKGEKYEDLTNFIQSVSRLVYERTN